MMVKSRRLQKGRRGKEGSTGGGRHQKGRKRKTRRGGRAGPVEREAGRSKRESAWRRHKKRKNIPHGTMLGRKKEDKGAHPRRREGNRERTASERKEKKRRGAWKRRKREIPAQERKGCLPREGTGEDGESEQSQSLPVLPADGLFTVRVSEVSRLFSFLSIAACTTVSPPAGPFAARLTHQVFFTVMLL